MMNERLLGGQYKECMCRHQASVVSSGRNGADVIERSKWTAPSLALRLLRDTAFTSLTLMMRAWKISMRRRFYTLQRASEVE